MLFCDGQHNAVSNISGYRYMSDCRSRGRKFNHGLVPYSHTFVEIVHEIISMTILLPSTDLRGVVIRYKRKYVHKVLVNSLVKLAKKKKVVR